MSEYALLVIGTIFGGISALGTIAIVALMWRETRRPVGERKYWPWLMVMALIALTSLSPGYMTYRLANFEAPSTVLPSASTASLRLLLREGQEPDELSNNNVWRWHVFRSVNQTTSGNRIIIGTYFFLVFNKPVSTAYKKVFVVGHPSWRFEIADFSPRSMVALLPNEDVDGSVVNFEISDKPL